MDVSDLFDVPLVDLGTVDASYRGILTPAPEVDRDKEGVTDQFLADARTYHERYSNAAHFLSLFSQVFAATGKPDAEAPLILDIGTGSGINTVVPCMELFPGCRLVATDISPQLLVILREFLRANDLADRVAPVATDAMLNHFRPQSFDLVVGASILHHLIDPSEALAAAHRALKPGGTAIFFEPFEGFSLLRAAFETILDRAPEQLPVLPERLDRVLRAFIRDFEMRAGSDKSNPLMRYMDDKWLFTRSYVVAAAKRTGFAAAEFVPLHSPSNLFRELALGLFRMADPGIDAGSVPAWVIKELERYDRCLSDDMKKDILFEAGIVLRA
jgi:SAM-dependent methyltransferase